MVNVGVIQRRAADLTSRANIIIISNLLVLNIHNTKNVREAQKNSLLRHVALYLQAELRGYAMIEIIPVSPRKQFQSSNGTGVLFKQFRILTFRVVLVIESVDSCRHMLASSHRNQANLTYQ